MIAGLLQRMKNSINIISVNYNNAAKCKELLHSLKSQENREFISSIVLVDNASCENDYRELKNTIKDYEDIFTIKLVRSEINLGYSRGLNLGLSKISVAQRNLVVMCNNDVRYNRSFVTKLSKIHYDDRSQVIFPDVVTDGVIHENPRYINGVSKFRQLGYWVYYTHYYVAILMEVAWTNLRMLASKKSNAISEFRCECYLGVGACFILTENYFQHHTCLDDRVFLWGEELLLSSQVRNSGGCQMYEPSISVHHDSHASVGKLPAQQRYQLMKQSYNIYKHCL